MSLEDPNTVSGEQTICYLAGKIAGKFPLGGEVVDYVCSASEAERNYVEYRTMLLRELKNTSPDEEQVRYFAAKLVQTASFGAQRRNFRMYYVDENGSGPLEQVDTSKIRKLPADPDDIMYGYWR